MDTEQLAVWLRRLPSPQCKELSWLTQQLLLGGGTSEVMLRMARHHISLSLAASEVYGADLCQARGLGDQECTAVMCAGQGSALCCEFGGTLTKLVVQHMVWCLSRSHVVLLESNVLCQTSSRIMHVFSSRQLTKLQTPTIPVELVKGLSID